MCGICGVLNTAPNLFDEDEIDRFIQGIYSGLINIRSLDLQTYLKVAARLTDGVYTGFGKNLSDVLYLSEDYQMLYALRDNVFIFSGAKQYQQIRHMSSLLTDNGKIVPFNEFKKQANVKLSKQEIDDINLKNKELIAQGKDTMPYSFYLDLKINGLFLKKYANNGLLPSQKERVQFNQ